MLIKNGLSASVVKPTGELCFAIGAYAEFTEKIDSSLLAAIFFRRIWNTALLTEQEEVYAAFVDNNNDLLDYKLIHRGGTSSCTFDTALILRYALLCKASGIFIAHNHPTGSLVPSKPDKLSTENFHESCELLKIRLLDHIILTEKSYYSFHEGGLL